MDEAIQLLLAWISDKQQRELMHRYDEMPENICSALLCIGLCLFARGMSNVSTVSGSSVTACRRE